jgi:regulator of sigma E protease
LNIIYILIGILLLGVLVILHELAHFTLAKINKVKVEEFSVGMGPLLTSIQGKETVYSIRALPIGGYVRMLGEEEESKDERAFSSKSPLRKLSIVAAGPIMNLLVAIVIFAFLGYVSGFATTTITTIMEDSPALQVGLQAGDKIIKINDSKISSWNDITTEIILNKNKPLELTVERSGVEYDFNLTPMYLEEEDRYLIGITPRYEENPSLGESLAQGIKQVNTITKQTFISLGRMFRGEASKDEVGGPVTIIRVTSMAAKAGFLNLLYLGGFISMSFAIFNILPIPALDGGWIVLFLIQIITRKEIDQKYVAIINKIGFTFLLFLMVAVTIKDILFPVQF